MNENALQGENYVELNLATLPKGIYFAQIMLEGNASATRRFVVSKWLSLFQSDPVNENGWDFYFSIVISL